MTSVVGTVVTQANITGRKGATGQPELRVDIQGASNLASRSCSTSRSPQQKFLDREAGMGVGVFRFLMACADANRLYLFGGFSFSDN